MTATTEVRLDVDPLPAPRPRFRTIRTKAGKTIASAYSPANYRDWKKAAEALLLRALSDAFEPYTGPVECHCEFVIKRPKKTVRVSPAGDVDNYVKALLDAMTNANVWKDDDQVTSLVATKRWTNEGEEPHILFTLREAPPP